MAERIHRHLNQYVYKLAFQAASEISILSKNLPIEERYSLTDQIRQSSRSVCANITEAWRKSRYQAAFINKLNTAEAEASETQVWLDFCIQCNYLDKESGDDLYMIYNHIIGKLVNMIRFPEKWILNLQ